MSKLANDIESWTQVRLFDWFDRNYGSNTQPWEQMVIFRNWCQDNITPNYWSTGGVTIFSYRMYFNNPEDATLFRLVFGV